MRSSAIEEMIAIDNRQITLSEILDAVYCRRRWYLRTVEKSDAQNVDMIRGKIEHETVDKPLIRSIDGIVTATGLTVYSNTYDLFGICDVVQFRECDGGIELSFCDYAVDIVPIEYKHGKMRVCNEYIAQVTAQAICLEEMYSCCVRHGGIYFVDDKEYYNFNITDQYRKLVFDAVNFIQNYDFVPVKATYSRKCKGCAVFDECCPRELNIKDYMTLLWGD